ncbi:MAG: hypothetical protein ACKV0T_17865 [Planctomycetales bacterium]
MSDVDVPAVGDQAEVVTDQPLVDDNEDDFEVRLSIVKARAVDGDLACTLRIANRSQESIVWDGEFAVFLTWEVVDETGRSLLPEKVRDIDQELEQTDRGRFVSIAPGESYSREFRFSTSIRTFRHARAAIAGPDGGTVVVPVASEAIEKYVVPQESLSIRVTVQYDSLDPDAQDGFAAYFRMRPEAIQILKRQLKSNVAVITLN